MKNLRLAEVLPALVAARAWAPWTVAPWRGGKWRDLERRVAAARLGGDAYPTAAQRRLFDDVQ